MMYFHSEVRSFSVPYSFYRGKSYQNATSVNNTVAQRIFIFTKFLIIEWSPSLLCLYVTKYNKPVQCIVAPIKEVSLHTSCRGVGIDLYFCHYLLDSWCPCYSSWVRPLHSLKPKFICCQMWKVALLWHKSGEQYVSWVIEQDPVVVKIRIGIVSHNVAITPEIFFFNHLPFINNS